MAVPTAIKELEKIEMVQGFDHVYRLDYAVTATQKTILGAFDISDSDITLKIAYFTSDNIKYLLNTINPLAVLY